MFKKTNNPYVKANFLLLFVAIVVYIFGTKVLPNITGSKDGYYTPKITVNGEAKQCPIGILAIDKGVQYIGGYEASKLLGGVETEEMADGTGYRITHQGQSVIFLAGEKAITIETGDGQATQTEIGNPPLYVEGMWYIPVAAFEIAFGYSATVQITEEAILLDFIGKQMN